MPAGLNTAHRTAARVAAIRAPYPGTDALPARTGPHGGGRSAAAEVLAPVVHIADRTPRPPRDGAARNAHAPRIDAQNRVNLGKALRALGWTPQTLLVATRENGHVVIRAEADSPLLIRVPVDADRRLTLPPAVLVAAVADALQLLTGALPTAGPESAPVPARRTSGSRVRGRWQPADDGSSGTSGATSR